MFTKQSGNTAENIVGGDQQLHVTNNYVPPSILAPLYKRLREADANQPANEHIVEQLRHYCSVDSDGDIRGLEEKLKDSERQDLLLMATKLKEAASMKIMKWQTSGVAQEIITSILAHIHTAFTLHVVPIVQAGGSRIEVDQVISEKVIKPTETMLGDNDLVLTHVDLLGMLFFLGGNCHVRWDKC